MLTKGKTRGNRLSEPPGLALPRPVLIAWLLVLQVFWSESTM